MSDWSPTATRIRAVVADHFAVVVLLLVVTAAVGGFLAVDGYSTSSLSTETRQVATWESAARFDHRATVVNGTGPFETGAVLRNRTYYFLRLTPSLNGSFAYRYQASEGGNLTVDGRAVLVARSTVGEDDDATELWRSEDTLATRSVSSLSPGQPFRIPFVWNVTESREDARDLETRLGGTPGQPELFVEVRLTLSGTRNGRAVDRIRTYRLPVTFAIGTYQVEDPGTTTHGDARTRQVTVPARSSPVNRIGGPMLTVVGLAAAGGLLYGRRTGTIAVTDRERRRLDHHATREEYDEWITVVSDVEALAENPVRVESLQGLVDLAIDTDARVLEETARGRYLVRHDGVTYVYELPSTREDSWSDRDSSAAFDDPGTAAGREATEESPAPEQESGDDTDDTE
jgi:hypothetical protein